MTAGERYAERRDRLRGDKAQLDAADRRLSSARGLTFLVAGALALAALFRHDGALGLGAAAAAAVFVFFVVRHALVATRQFECERRIELVRRGEQRIDGSFRASDAEAHRRGVQFAAEGHPYAADLDLFGAGGLFELFDTAVTRQGEALLAGWLLEPAGAAQVAARQAAARELAGKDAFREELALAGMSAGAAACREASALIDWCAERDVTLPLAGLLLLLCVQLGLGVAAAVGPAPWLKPWGIAVVLQIAAGAALRPRLEAVLAPITAKGSPLAGYAPMMRLCQAEGFADASLSRLQSALEQGGGAAQAMARLERAVGFAAVRHNALASLLANAFLLWDVWSAARLQAWRRRSGARVPRWLDALAEIEALGCLGTFAAEHASFCWPTVTCGHAHFRARGLGHPLIGPAARVGNDLELATGTGGAPPSALMITGSNMAGKSTLLRAVGLAAAMAQAGAPVCAEELACAELRVWTSMRVDDSVTAGASRFLAEVRRLKAVLDAVRAGGKPVLFLLDEVLHGTNSRERILGAKAVALHLVERGAIGAITSHDLGLVALEQDSGGRVANMHFEEQAHDAELAFDYRMRPGPVATSNALRLMRQVGIDVVPEG